jgi:hypothetical protein
MMHCRWRYQRWMWLIRRKPRRWWSLPHRWLQSLESSISPCCLLTSGLPTRSPPPPSLRPLPPSDHHFDGWVQAAVQNYDSQIWFARSYHIEFELGQSGVHSTEGYSGTAAAGATLIITGVFSFFNYHYILYFKLYKTFLFSSMYLPVIGHQQWFEAQWAFLVSSILSSSYFWRWDFTGNIFSNLMRKKKKTWIENKWKDWNDKGIITASHSRSKTPITTRNPRLVQTGEGWNAGVNPKAMGGHNLDAATRQLPDLEHFVMFSSIVASAGNEGTPLSMVPLPGVPSYPLLPFTVFEYVRCLCLLHPVKCNHTNYQNRRIAEKIWSLMIIRVR